MENETDTDDEQDAIPRQKINTFPATVGAVSAPKDDKEVDDGTG